jgi:toxin ParE1/3/4
VDFKLIWTEKARNDVGAIVRYLSRHASPKVAKEIGFGLYDRTSILITNPEAGSILREKRDANWRKLIYKSWKIAYRISNEERVVYIARIWHVAQDEIDIE